MYEDTEIDPSHYRVHEEHSLRYIVGTKRMNGL